MQTSEAKTLQMLSNTAKLESKKKPLLNEISTRKKIKETPKHNYQ